MSNTRSKMIRRAASMPKGSPERKALLATLMGTEKNAAEKMLYTVTINVPKDDAKAVQKALDTALNAAIKKIRGMEGHKGVTSKLRD